MTKDDDVPCSLTVVGVLNAAPAISGFVQRTRRFWNLDSRPVFEKRPYFNAVHYRTPFHYHSWPPILTAMSRALTLAEMLISLSSSQSLVTTSLTPRDAVTDLIDAYIMP